MVSCRLRYFPKIIVFEILHDTKKAQRNEMLIGTRLLVNTTKNEDGEEQFNIEMDFKGLEMSMLKMFKSGVAEEPEPEVDDEDEEDDG